MFQYLTELDQLSNLIDHVAETVVKVVPRISAYRPGVDEAYLPSIDDFVLYVTIRSYTTVPELMMSLIYLSQFHQSTSKPPGIGRASTPHRVFLAALVLAHKVYNDDSADNAQWAEFSAIPECGFAGFSDMEVDLMERQFLEVLEWDEHISADLYDLLSQKICTTPAYPSPFCQRELDWACACCLCLDGWADSTRGLSHCFACLTPSYPEVEMQKKVVAMEQSHVLQRSTIENGTCTARDRQVAPACRDAPIKCNGAPIANAF
jgi:hypothetical protein